MRRRSTAAASARARCAPGITTETQADEVAQLLFYEDLKDVVLVGTSSGGMVACRVAELMRERIGRLVFVDALALFDGEKIRDIVTRSTATATRGLTAGPSREDAANRLFADLDPADPRLGARALYASTRSASTTSRSSSTSSGRSHGGASVIWCRRAQNPGEAHQRRTAEKLGASWAELDTGHYPMLSMPDELTAMLLKG